MDDGVFSDVSLRTLPDLVSVIIPVRNGGALFERQVAALAAQTYGRPWELIVADNGSDDDTSERAATWVQRFPVPLRIIDASAARGCSGARNVGSEAAGGDLLVYCDADDEVAPGWLAAMAGAACTAGVVGGWLETELLNEEPARSWRPAYDRRSLPTAIGWLPFAVGASLGVWRDVYDELGGFREDFPSGADDTEFCWRAQVAGRTIVLEPEAVVHYRFRTDLRSMARQFRNYGHGDVLLFRDFREHGIRRRSVGDVLYSLVWLVKHLPDLRDDLRKGIWVREAAYLMGRARGSWQQRLLYL